MTVCVCECESHLHQCPTEPETPHPLPLSLPSLTVHFSQGPGLEHGSLKDNRSLLTLPVEGLRLDTIHQLLSGWRTIFRQSSHSVINISLRSSKNNQDTLFRNMWRLAVIFFVCKLFM